MVGVGYPKNEAEVLSSPECGHPKPPEAASCWRKAAGRLCLGQRMSPAWERGQGLVFRL